LYTVLSVGVVAVLGALTFGVSTAGAIPVPTGGTSGHWFIGKVETDRNTGSDTTIFLMQQIADLYNQAALYGCQLNADESTCNTTGDIATTDTQDNYDRDEEYVGIDDVGSGAGQGQLCGTVADPSNLPVDFARSSKPPGTACSDMVGLGFGKDGVPAVDFPTVNPDQLYGAVPSSSPYASVNGGAIGPVAEGWLPSDPIGGPYTGTPFTNLTNNDSGGGANSVAYRIWCSTATSGPDARITDWGQLTNLDGGTLPVGSGAPIGIPINVVGVNTSSGTDATFSAFAESGVTGGNCASNSDTNSPSNEIALENNTSQIGDFAAADFPGDAADQAVFIGSSLYYESNGVYNTNPHAKSVQITSGTTTTSFTAVKLQENGVSAGTATDLDNAYPTARTLYNIYRTGTVRASTANFLNWICDSNNAFTKGTDLSTGVNYDQELTNLISTKFGFPRLTDTSPSPNNSCQLITTVHDPNS
jgi:hypothetical protein